ncbi:hypothetical protein BGX33_002514 [Mortierella sp. NVP41]|nr:hypothetical protein BGX33_002514 [Mortierella sp. NVP41]
MVYKGKNFDPNFHLKKNFDRNLRPSENNSINNTTSNPSTSNNSNNTNGSSSSSSGNSGGNGGNNNKNTTATSTPGLAPINFNTIPVAKRSDRPSSRTSSMDDNDHHQTSRSSSRPPPPFRREEERQADKVSAQSNNNDPLPPPPPFSRHHHHDDRRDLDRDRYSSSGKRDREWHEDEGPGKGVAGGNYYGKRYDPLWAKKTKPKAHLRDHPEDKQAHSVYRTEFRKPYDDRDHDRALSKTPAPAPPPAPRPRDGSQQRDNDNSKDRNHQEHRQGSFGDDHRYQNNNISDNITHHISDSHPHPQGRRNSATTTASTTESQNSWSQSPSVLSNSSWLHSPASSTTDIHPGPFSSSPRTQSYNWTDHQGGAVPEPRPPGSTEHGTSISKQATLQGSNVLPPIQRVDDRINILDSLWKSGQLKLDQAKKDAESIVLTCVLNQVLDESRIYAKLRETLLQYQDLNAQIRIFDASEAVLQNVKSSWNYDLNILLPGVPIPEMIPPPPGIQVDTPLTGSSSGGVEPDGSTAEAGPSGDSQQPLVSSDQTHSTNVDNLRKRALEGADPNKTQTSKTTKYRDKEDMIVELSQATTDNPQGAQENDTHPSHHTLHQSSLDLTIKENGVLSNGTTTATDFSTSSVSSAGPPSSLTAATSLTEVESTQGRTTLLENNPTSQPTPASSIFPSLATSTVADIEPASSFTAAAPFGVKAGLVGVALTSGRVLDLEQELRLIREEGREQRLRTDQLLAQLDSEARLRREADQMVSQLTQDLNKERVSTLEKDLQGKRAEALLMMAKAREEVQQSKLMVAQAQEEVARARADRAEAVAETARVEAERLRLVAYVQSLGGSAAAGAGGVGNGKVAVSALSTLSTPCPSPSASEEGGGHSAVVPGSRAGSGPDRAAGDLSKAQATAFKAEMSA